MKLHLKSLLTGLAFFVALPASVMADQRGQGGHFGPSGRVGAAVQPNHVAPLVQRNPIGSLFQHSHRWQGGQHNQAAPVVQQNHAGHVAGHVGHAGQRNHVGPAVQHHPGGHGAQHHHGGHGVQRHPGWHRDVRSFPRHDTHHWRSGGWHHAHHGGRLGWWWVVGGLWHFYPQPVYPYPDPYQSAVVMVEPQPQVVVAPQSAPQVWHFCDASQTYYPYVETCEGGWRTVPATPYGDPQ